MKRLIAIFAVAAVVGVGIALWFVFSGHESDAGGIPVTPGPALQFDVRGAAGNISADTPGQGGSFLVKGTPLGQSGVDYAAVRVTPDTRIYVKSGGSLALADFAALRDGQTVEVDLLGPVAESYPVQATAGTVVIVQ
jgi:hypothetical protein